jgi:glycosyltransferase involved in cell wall biosynthesis
MKIGYILDTDPLTDRRAYSGINYYTCKALMKVGFEVVWIPVKHYFFEKALFGLKKRLFRLFGKNIDSSFIWRAFFSNLSIDRKLLDTVDYVLVHHITDGYFLRTRKPIITYQDCTLFSCIDYYSEITGLTKWNKSDIKQLERRLYGKSSRIIAASDWQAASLRTDYFIPNEKIVRINFGANIDDDGILPRPVASPFPESDSTVNILFIGIDWIRKGGNMAIFICEELIKKGINAHLDILGSLPDIPTYTNLLKSGAYTFHVRLNKNNPEDYRRFTDILSKADLLLAPTIAEGAGIMFCEASAYGIPIFTHHTGGTASYVVNGVNGYGFPVGTDAKVFADKIKECIISGELKNMRKTGRLWYEQELSWDLFGKKFKRMIEQIEEEQNNK